MTPLGSLRGQMLLLARMKTLRQIALSTETSLPKIGFVKCNYTVSTVQEIEAAMPRLSRSEVEQLRQWIDNYLEDKLELTDEVKGKIEQSRREIASRQFTARKVE